MQNYEIIFYDKADGTEPAKEFIKEFAKHYRAEYLGRKETQV